MHKNKNPTAIIVECDVSLFLWLGYIVYSFY